MDRTLLKTELLAKFSLELEKYLADGKCESGDITGMEQRSRELAKKLGGLGLQAVLLGRCAEAGRGYQGSSVPCREEGCAHALKFMDYRSRPLKTYLGDIEFSRAYYWGPLCHHSWFPLDDKLGMLDGDYSPLLKDGVGVAAALDTFRGGAAQLERYALVEICPTAVRTTGEVVGRHLLEQATERAELAWGFDAKPGTGERPERAVKEAPKHGVVIVDGTMVPALVEQEPGKAPKPAKSRQPKTEEEQAKREYREVKVGMVFRTEDWVRPEKPDGRGQILDKEFVTKLGTKNEFAPLLWEVIRAWRIDEAREQTWLGDGSHWIWDLAALLLPNAKQVVDPWHVSEKIHDTAKEVFGRANPFAKKWAERYYAGIWELGERGVDAMLTALAALNPKSKAARKKVDELKTYATNNKQRMAYDVYRKEGRPIASSPIEGANAHLVSKRIEVPGATWLPEAVDAILASRCRLFSGRWDAPARSLVA